MELSGLGAVVGEVNILKKKQKVNVVGDVNNHYFARITIEIHVRCASVQLPCATTHQASPHHPSLLQ